LPYFVTVNGLQSGLYAKQEQTRQEIMARRCEICGKGTVAGNNISHAHNKTKRVWKPNIVKVQTIINGSRKTIKICTRCLKSGKVVKV
jgi:large subunit ribosomal protein L28